MLRNIVPTCFPHDLVMLFKMWVELRASAMDASGIQAWVEARALHRIHGTFGHDLFASCTHGFVYLFGRFCLNT